MGAEDEADTFRTNVVLVAATVAVVGSLAFVAAFVGVILSKTVKNIIARKSRDPRRRKGLAQFSSVRTSRKREWRKFFSSNFSKPKRGKNQNGKNKQFFELERFHPGDRRRHPQDCNFSLRTISEDTETFLRLGIGRKESPNPELRKFYNQLEDRNLSPIHNTPPEFGNHLNPDQREKPSFVVYRQRVSRVSKMAGSQSPILVSSRAVSKQNSLDKIEEFVTPRGSLGSQSAKWERANNSRTLESPSSTLTHEELAEILVHRNPSPLALTEPILSKSSFGLQVDFPDRKKSMSNWSEPGATGPVPKQINITTVEIPKFEIGNEEDNLPDDEPVTEDGNVIAQITTVVEVTENLTMEQEVTACCQNSVDLPQRRMSQSASFTIKKKICSKCSKDLEGKNTLEENLVEFARRIQGHKYLQP